MLSLDLIRHLRHPQSVDKPKIQVLLLLTHHPQGDQDTINILPTKKPGYCSIGQIQLILFHGYT